MTVLAWRASVSLQVNGGGLVGTSSSLTVVLPADGTQPVLLGTSGYALRGPGTLSFSVPNRTGGSITQVVITAPPGWSFDPALTSTSMTGWSVHVTASQATFTTGGAAPLAHLATGTFTTGNTGGLYPNVAVDTNYAVGVQWSGFQTGSHSATFRVLTTIGEVLLPAISRSAGSARPTFYWTNSDENRPHAGVVVIRGDAAPEVGVAYAPGAVLGGSTVVCVDPGTGTQCTESTSVTQDDTAQIYSFFNHDDALVYSMGIRISAPARPTTGFVYKHQVTGLTPPGVRPAPIPSGFAVFGAQDRGLYFVRIDGVEERRAVETLNAVVRRTVPLSDASSGYAAFTADSGSPNAGQIYRVEPTGSAMQSVSNAPVHSGVAALMATSASVLNSFYKANGPALLYGSNAASNNFIRAFQPNLATYWTLDIGGDAITHEGNTDSSHAYMFVPVGAGGGGIYGFDMSVSPGSGAAPPPPGWPGRKILAGTLFKSQCRMAPAGWAMRVLFCGSHDGQVFAIHADTGAALATAAVTGSVQGLVPLQTSGVVIYTTRSGRIGRLFFDGTNFLTTTTPPQPPVFEVGITGVSAVSTALPLSDGIYVGGAGRLHRLDPSTGAVLNSVGLDGNQVSEVAVETNSSTIFVQTSAGTIWGVPKS